MIQVSIATKWKRRSSMSFTCSVIDYVRVCLSSGHCTPQHLPKWTYCLFQGGQIYLFIEGLYPRQPHRALVQILHKSHNIKKNPLIYMYTTANMNKTKNSTFGIAFVCRWPGKCTEWTPYFGDSTVASNNTISCLFGGHLHCQRREATVFSCGGCV